MSSSPWLKFYPSDWRADPALRMCSVAARGLWIEMLCVMHEATPYGSMRVNGRAVSDSQIAILAGASIDDVTIWLAELESAGAFSRDDDGVIFSRRMQRDKAKAESDKKNGKRGGNPELGKGVNPPDNPPVKAGDKAQKPEARDQNNYAAKARDPLQGREGEMLAALGVTDETKLPGLLILSEPYHWVTNGCDIDLDILPTLRSFGAKGKPIKSWGYCTAAVFEARDKRLAPGPAVQQRQATGPPSPASEPTTGNIWTREASDLGYFDEFASPKTQRNAHGDRTGNRGRAFPTIDVAVQKN
mgnify:CR=1 FL=1